MMQRDTLAKPIEPIAHPASREILQHSAVNEIPGSNGLALDTTTSTLREPQRQMGPEEPGATRAALPVSEPGDMYEQEAERVASTVTQTPSMAAETLHKPGTEGILQAQETGKQTPEAASGMQASPAAIQGEEQSLPESTRAFFEPRFGYDFSQVRVHTDPQAAESARSMHALAYTLGRDIVFGSGQYTPEQVEGKRLLAHELTHVVQQQKTGIPMIARQTQPVKQYQTEGVSIPRPEIEKLVGVSYWEQRVRQVYATIYVSPVQDRFNASPEERDAVLSVLWKVKPAGPLTAETTRVVSIPARPAPSAPLPTSPAGPASMPAPAQTPTPASPSAPKPVSAAPSTSIVAATETLLYQFTFKPRPKDTPQGQESVEIAFLAKGSAATVAAAPLPSAGYTPQQFTPSTSGFPEPSAEYWKKYPDEKRQLFNWIENVVGQSFEQVVTTKAPVPQAKKPAIHESSYSVKGKKDAQKKITSLDITFLGPVSTTSETPTEGYKDKDFADLHLEQAQSKADPKKQDHLGKVTYRTPLPSDEALAVKEMIVQYFAAGQTRNAEADAIIPIPNTTRRVLYTFRFLPGSNDVDVERVGEKVAGGKFDPSRLDITRVNGYGNNSNDLGTLQGWLKKRYPGVPATGTSVQELTQNMNSALQAKAGTVAWFSSNYGIEILDDTSGADRLRKVHNLSQAQLADMKTFQASELQLLELALETVSDALLAKFRGLRFARQKVYIEKKGKDFQLDNERGGNTFEDGSERTVVIYDSASMNDALLFLGGQRKVLPASAQTYTHELGHVVAFSSPQVKKAFDEFVKKKNIQPVTKYAGTKPAKEFFPEAFSLYNTDPEWMQTNLPDLFDWFEKLSKTGNAPPP